MLLMRGFWQLADMHLCFLHVPTMLKVCRQCRQMFVSWCCRSADCAEGAHAFAVQHLLCIPRQLGRPWGEQYQQKTSTRQ